MLSPRLIEACKRQGILPDELCKKNFKEIKEKYKKEGLNREGLLLASKHYEERRVAKLKLVLNVKYYQYDNTESHLFFYRKGTN